MHDERESIVQSSKPSAVWHRSPPARDRPRREVTPQAVPARKILFESECGESRPARRVSFGRF
jgi:hypothetical protein